MRRRLRQRARALGVMTGRMHVSLERAFGRRAENVAARLDIVATRLRTEDPSLLETPGLATVVEALRTAGTRLTTSARTGISASSGWRAPTRLDGRRHHARRLPPGRHRPEFRSPLEDVADMFWSFHRVALAAALEREPSDFGSLIDQAKAWEARNRRAFLVGYLATAGIAAWCRPTVRWSATWSASWSSSAPPSGVRARRLSAEVPAVVAVPT